MKFRLTFDIDNEAFHGANGPEEVGRILREVANQVEEGQLCSRVEVNEFKTGTAIPVRDMNGNTVGAAQITGKR